jgi:RimJ/RimL family protein N-acetyltransferase
MTTITTERLLLRPFNEDDIPAYAAIRRQPGVTRFLPSHTDDPAESDRRAAATVRAFARLWDDPGYGPWAVIAGDRLIGHAGLRWVAEAGATEVLYLLDPAAHGRGYATEAARAALEFGFANLGLERIVAWAMAENTASTAVMERLGMRRNPEPVTVFGVRAVEYSATRPVGARDRAKV